MEKVKEVIKRVMGNVQNMKDSNVRFETGRCSNCKKPFKYDKSEHFYSPPEYCCPKCREEGEGRRRKIEIEQAITDEIPLKFQTIETDKTNLFEGLSNKSVFITGKIGTGKTVLMASLAKKYIRNRKRIEWISYPAFIMELQSAYKKDGEETPFEMAEDAARFKGVLCIDDIGAEKLTDFVKQITYFIVNEREQRMLITLITSNFSLAEIDTMIDTRISSRIAGMCECVMLKGKDRRLEK